jgi:signal transduction histidine kinase
VGLLDEKNVMLGAIGHDLKTPLAALRVRIEAVEDDAERARMAATIEDINRSLDDILSLARVGRPSDPLETTELSALVTDVMGEYEDMGEDVTLEDTVRIVLRCAPRGCAAPCAIWCPTPCAMASGRASRWRARAPRRCCASRTMVPAFPKARSSG